MAFIDDIVKFHSFSKSTVRTGLTLGEAVNPSGHTVTSKQVRTDDIPWFVNSFQGDEAKARTWAAANATDARHNDILYYGAEFKVGFTAPKCLIYVSKQEVDGKLVDLPAEQCGWQTFDLNAATTLKNSEGKAVIAIHKNAKVEYVDGNNNAATNSNQQSLFVRRADGTLLDHFVAATDQIVGGQPSLGYNAVVSVSGKAIDEGEGTGNYIGNTYAGIVHFHAARSESKDTDGSVKGITVTCFEYIGDKLDTTVSQLAAAVFGGSGSDPDDVSLTQKVAQNTAAIATLNGTGEGSVAKALADAKAYAEGQASAAKSGAETTAANALSAARTEITAEIAAAKEQAIAGSTVTLTADAAEGKTGITIDPNGEASNAFTVGIDQSIIATVASVTAITNIITDNKEEIDGKISTINGILEGLTTGDNSISAKIQAVTDRLSPDGDIGQAIASKVASVTLGTAPEGVSLGTDTKNRVLTIETASSKSDGENSKLVTGGVAKEIAKYYGDLAVDTIDDRSLVNTDSSTQGAYVAVTTSGTIGDGLTVNVDDAALASTVSAAASAIQTVKVNGAALSATNNAVDITAIVGVDTTIHNGIRLFEAEDNKVALEVAPATYDVDTDTWSEAAYFTTAGDVSSAISALSDRVDTITDLKPTLENTVEGVNFLTHFTGYKHLSISDAIYTPSSESGEIGAWTDSTKNYLVTGATVAAAISDVNAKVDALHKTPQFKVEVVTNVTDLTKWEESVTDGIQENYIYLVQNPDAADGSYIEYIAYKNGKTIVTERIGTTKTDLSGYVKTVTINGQSYAATANNAGTINIGKAASSIASGQATTLANQGSVYGHIADNGTLTLGVASADDSTFGVSKLFTNSDILYASSGITNTAVSLHTAQTMYNVLSNLANSKISSVEGTEYLGLAALAVSSRNGSAYVSNQINTSNLALSNCAEVVENGVMFENNTNGAYAINTNAIIFESSTDSLNFNNRSDNRLKTWSGDMSNLKCGGYMFKSCSALTSFCGDLSSMTDGCYMFQSCSALTSFCGDLGSLTKACWMFEKAKLDVESLECIADTINDVSSLAISGGGSKEIGIGYNCSAAAAQAAQTTIQAKGWNCTMTYNA